ncbi:cache domain-containing sensor histidine kinase [Paenibacillus lentus]|uniref:Sensor histidine kinase n=1 Tax=Paenibacillus lentus TaxID=1338368 RepID=A0A3Q8S4J7_9BACL|nr:sensor histidine kinase [Paenibacillus lentus]AZK46328.1 sensor histidine kinase [Paenibacillus lentus]
MSLRRKLSIMMLVSILIPLLFLGSFAFITSSRVTEEKTKLSGIETLRQMDGNLKFIIQDVENISLFLISQSDVQQYLSAANEDEKVKSRIVGMMMNLASSKSYIADISIVSRKFPDTMSTATLYESDLPNQVNIRKVTDKMWTGVYQVKDYSGLKNVITFIRPLRSTHNYSDLGWLAISIDEKAISQYWSQPKLGEGSGQVALLNEHGHILSATEKGWLSKPLDELYPKVIDQFSASLYGSTTYGEGASKQTILHFREPSVGWMLIGFIPYEQYSAQNRYILQLTIAAVALAVMISVGLILFVVQRVMNPLRLLTRLLAKIDPEAPLPLFPADSGDEIGKLGASYNMLGRHIEKLKAELIRNEARKKEADILALQAQINPHFLYNTLSSIHWIALMADEKRIAGMVEALSDFLRISLNQGKEFYPVRQEMAHIQNYAQVQAIRFPDKFNIDFIIDENLQNKYMLKLLLQPLVENALIHGIQKKEGIGTITVYLEQKGNVMSFLVLDDGIGMTEERLAAVRANLQPNGEQAEARLTTLASYGLRNVNERLILHYGSDARLQIESKLHVGTRVSFSIPILEEYDENHDS